MSMIESFLTFTTSVIIDGQRRTLFCKAGDHLICVNILGNGLDEKRLNARDLRGWVEYYQAALDLLTKAGEQ